MKILLRVGAFIYVMLVLSVCCIGFSYIFGKFGANYVIDFLYHASSDEATKMAMVSFFGVIMFLTILFYKIFLVNIFEDKVIAFDNPSGRVSVSLLALEDLVRRKIIKLFEVKEVKTKIRASGKKGLRVTIRLTLKSEGNIPDLTSSVQEITKKRIQDIIGIDEPVNISVYIGKIISEERDQKKRKEASVEDQNEPNIPFQGYRA